MATAAPGPGSSIAAPQDIGTSAITAAAPILRNPGASTTLCFTANITSPDAEYTGRVEADLPDDWTLGAVSANSTSVANGCGAALPPVSFTVTAPVTHTVTFSVGTPSGTITPLGAQTVTDGATATFTLTPDAGYFIDSVGGTCGGTLTGTSYTTNVVTIDCTVIANFAVDIIPVTTVVPAGHGTVSVPATVTYGGTASYMLTPDPGYGIGSVTGCGGTLTGGVYVTGPITGACTITASFVLLAGPAPVQVPATGWQMLLLMMGLLLGGGFIALRRAG